jgi:hypothetical protein
MKNKNGLNNSLSIIASILTIISILIGFFTIDLNRNGKSISCEWVGICVGSVQIVFGSPQNLSLTQTQIASAYEQTSVASTQTIIAIIQTQTALMRPTIIPTLLNTSVPLNTPTPQPLQITTIPPQPTLPPNFREWSMNGHIYELIEVPDGISWESARLATESKQFRGLQGHLATVTSAQENGFLVGAFGDAIINKWLGGFQRPNSVEPSGGWSWITNEGWSYSNWHDGVEPNEYERGENALHYKWLSSGAVLGEWNDLRSARESFNSHILSGYIVEYE